MDQIKKNHDFTLFHGVHTWSVMVSDNHTNGHGVDHI